MTIPSTPEARLYRAGAALGSEWGVEVDIGTGHEIKTIKSANLPGARNQGYLMLKESGNTFLTRGIAGAVDNCDIAPEAYMRYEAGPLGVILACLFGASPTPATIGSGAFLHTMTWEPSSLGKFVSYAEEYPGKIYSVPSAKPVKVVFSLQDGVLKITPTLRGNIVINDSAVNPELDDLTCLDEENEVLLSDCTAIWMREFDEEAALDADDQKGASGFEITFGRGLESAKPLAGQSYLAEAQEEDFSDIRVKLDFPFEDEFNREFFEHYIIGQYYSLIMKFQGIIIGSTYTYELNLYFPKLRLSAMPDMSKEGLIRVSAEFQATDAAYGLEAEPAGFDEYLPYLELQNTQETAYIPAA